MPTGFENIYQKLPVLLQNIGCSYYGWKKSKNLYGPNFNNILNRLLISEKWSKNEIEAYQNEKLHELIHHAYVHVPYYRETMKKLNLYPGDIKTRDDLHKLPVLTKEEVRANIDKLVADSTDKKKLLVSHTSGTTGKALSLYTSREAETFQSAVWWRHRMRYGLHYNDWCVNFTGKVAVPENQNKPPYWRWNYPMRQVVINNQQITFQKIRDIIKFLDETDFKFYVGYPSIIHSLAATANQMGLTLNNHPKIIAFGAENSTDFQIQDIKKFTTATLTEHYGSVEGCGSASYCPHNVFHEDFEYGILECVDPDIQEDGTISGKIVCTGFANFDFPLIRYEIGDIATWAPVNYQCPCGLQSNVIMHIDGRNDDYIITPEGRKSKDMEYVFHNTDNVRDAQIVQYKCDELIVRIVQRNRYTEKDEESIKDGIRRWISQNFEILFEYVNEIEREPNGKQRFVKNYIKKNKYNSIEV